MNNEDDDQKPAEGGADGSTGPTARATVGKTVRLPLELAESLRTEVARRNKETPGARWTENSLLVEVLRAAAERRWDAFAVYRGTGG